MSAKAALVVNGETREYDPASLPRTIAQLVASLGIDANMVVAEHNGDIIKRTDFAAQTLSDGDTVELVRFVGGG